MRDLATICDLAQAEIDDLRAAGIEPTAAEIVRINWLAWQVQDPATRLALARGVPVPLGRAYLWPLTLAAGEWVVAIADKLPARLQDAATAYAMAHGRGDADALPYDRLDAEKAVRDWLRALHATPAELAEACQQVLAQGETDEQQPRRDIDDPVSDMSAGDMSAFLTAACGGPPDIWERQCSIQYATAVMRAVIDQAASDGKPVRGHQTIAATKALGWYVKMIIESRKGKPNGA